MSEIRLRRGPLCRLVSSYTQLALSVVCLGTLAAVCYGLAAGKPMFSGDLVGWIWIVVLAVPGLGGVTARARADETGVRWRYWIRQVPEAVLPRRTLAPRSSPTSCRVPSTVWASQIRPTGTRGSPALDDIDPEDFQGLDDAYDALEA